MSVEIIVAVFGSVGGLAGIGALITNVVTLSNTKKAGEIANESSAVDALQKTIDAFEDVITDLKAERN